MIQHDPERSLVARPKDKLTFSWFSIRFLPRYIQKLRSDTVRGAEPVSPALGLINAGHFGSRWWCLHLLTLDPGELVQNHNMSRPQAGTGG